MPVQISPQTSSSGWCVRPLAPIDLVELAALECALFGADAWSLDQFRQELASPWRRYWGVFAQNPLPAAELADQPLSQAAAAGGSGPLVLVGYGGVQVLDVAEILTVGVSESWRGRGLGRYIMHLLLDEAKAVGEVFLEVRASNEAAIGLYRSLGFRIIDKRANYYSHPREAALIMRRRDKTMPISDELLDS